MNSYGNPSPYKQYTYDNKIVKKVKLEGVILTISKNKLSGKIFVEFSTKGGKLTLQRHFDNNPVGLSQAKEFEESIKSVDDLNKYFGLSTKENE